MTPKFLPITCALAGLLSAGALTAKAANATITLANGTTREAKVEGVGCSVAICSRVAIKATADNDISVPTRFDSLASIQTIDADHALLILKNGTEKRVGLLKDFRVLYVANPAGGADKLDLSNVKSVVFGR
jgi:hypothetical protein